MSSDKDSAVMGLRLRATELRRSGELVWRGEVTPHPGKETADVMGPDVIHNL